MQYAKISATLSKSFIKEMKDWGDDDPLGNCELEGIYYFPIAMVHQKKSSVSYYLSLHEPLNIYLAISAEGSSYSLDLTHIEIHKRNNAYSVCGLTIASDGEKCCFDGGLDVLSFEIVTTLP